MSTQVPQSVDARAMAQSAAVCEGSVPVASFSRLLAEHAIGVEDCQAKMQFAFDERRRATVKGSFNTKIEQSCRRCEQRFTSSLEGSFALGVVLNDEQAKNLPDGLDPILTEDAQIDVFSMIEDEIILNLPMMPLCGSETCQLTYNNVDAKELEKDKANKANPFAVLSQLKRDKKS